MLILALFCNMPFLLRLWLEIKGVCCITVICVILRPCLLWTLLIVSPHYITYGKVSAALLSWGWNFQACCCSKGLKAYKSCIYYLPAWTVAMHCFPDYAFTRFTFVRFIGMYVLLLAVTSLIGCGQRRNMPESFNLNSSAALCIHSLKKYCIMFDAMKKVC